MAKKIAELLIKLGADTLGIEKMSHDVRKQLNALQKDLQGFGKRMSMSLTAPLTAAAGASVYLADIQQQAERRLLVALHGREDVQQRLIRQAGELQSRSLYGDEELIGQQAYLASLGMTEQQIGRVIEASAQLATAHKMTLESAVKNLAKTYSGLTGELGENISELREFTAEELKNGKAVDIVLKKYKGFAEAAAETGLGPVNQLKMALGDLVEEFGAILMPVVQAVARGLKGLVEWLKTLSPETKTWIVALGGVAAALGPLALGLGGIIKLLPMLKAGFVALFSPVSLTVGVVTALGFGLFKLVTATTAAERANEMMEKRFADANRTIAAERYEIDQLFARLKAATEGTDEYAAAKQQIIDKYGTYLSRLGDEKTALKDIAKAYKEVVRESAKAARARTMNQIIADSAASYAKAQSEAYDKAKRLLERKFKGQRTEEGIDLPSYYLKVLKPALTGEADVNDEMRRIIGLFNVHQNMMGEDVTTNSLNDLIRSVRDAKEIADDAVAAADAKWGPTKEDNEAAAEQIGLLQRLQKQLTDLQDKKMTATTEDELARIERAIAKVQTEMTRLNNLGTVGLLGELEQKIAALEAAKKKATDPEKIRKLNGEIRYTALYLDKVSKNARVEGLDVSPFKALLFTDEEIAEQRRKIEKLHALAKKYPDNPDYAASAGRAEDRYRMMQFGRVTPPVFDPKEFSPSESDWTAAEKNLKDKLSNFIADTKKLVIDMAPMLSELFQGLAVGIGEGLGNIFSGDGTFDDMLASIGKMMGQFLKSLGAQLIELGTMVVMIKQSLEWAFKNPWTVIGMGVAAVALGTAMMNAFGRNTGKGVALAEGGLAYGPTMALVGDNRGAGSDPEVIAPLSKLRQYGFGRQAIEFIGGQFRLSGSDLLLSIRREDARITYVNALA